MGDDDDLAAVGRLADRVANELAHRLGSLEAVEVDLELPAGVARLGHRDRLGVEPLCACGGDDDLVVGVAVSDALGEKPPDLVPSSPPRV